jgi:hypothetical protein
MHYAATRKISMRVCLKMAAFLLAAALLICATGCNRKSIVIGIAIDTPPLSSRQSGQPDGFYR